MRPNNYSAGHGLQEETGERIKLNKLYPCSIYFVFLGTGYLECKITQLEWGEYVEGVPYGRGFPMRVVFQVEMISPF